MPETEIEIITHLMNETSAARERIIHKGKPSFAKVANLDRILDSLENGNPLSAGDLLRVYDLLDASSKAKDYGCREISEEEKDLLDSKFNQLSPLKRCKRKSNVVYGMTMTFLIQQVQGLKKYARKLKTQRTVSKGNSVLLSAENVVPIYLTLLLVKETVHIVLL